MGIKVKLENWSHHFKATILFSNTVLLRYVYDHGHHNQRGASGLE